MLAGTINGRTEKENPMFVEPNANRTPRIHARVETSAKE
jgi:hypothetical protein